MAWALRLAVPAAGLSLLAACSSAPPPVPPAPIVVQAPPPPPPKPIPTSVDGSIVAAAALNPSVSKRPSPLILRVYELRSATAFNQAEFMALYQADQATLAADLVSREEITLKPGEIRPYSKPLGADTRFIGVVAVYRDLEHSRWRSIVPIQLNHANVLTIHADTLAVTAAVSP